MKEGSHSGRWHCKALEHAGEERGGDAKGPRHEGSRRKTETLNFRLLQPFRFCSPVLEPDFHLVQILTLILRSEGIQNKLEENEILGTFWCKYRESFRMQTALVDLCKGTTLLGKQVLRNGVTTPFLRPPTVSDFII